MARAAYLYWVEELEAFFPSGGPLHILTEDGNVTDENLEFCRKSVFDPDQEHYQGLATWEIWHVKFICCNILDILGPLSVEDRKIIVGTY